MMLAFALSFLGFGKSLVSGVIQWLSRRSMAELACIALALVCALLIVANRAEKRHSAKLETQLVKCTQGREADRIAYVKAQTDASAKNKAHVIAVEAQQQRITTDVEARYQGDLARLRAELTDRLRHAADGAAKGSTGGSGLPAIPIATGKPDDPARLSVPTSLYVHGAEIELQLERLQDWVTQQSKVDPNKQ